MNNVRIFGREPAVFLALAGSLIKLISAFWINLSTNQQAVLNAIVAAAVGVAVAIVAKDAIVAALLGFAQALLSLAIGFGLDMTAENQAVVMSFVAVALGMFERTQVTAPVRPEPVTTSRGERVL